MPIRCCTRIAIMLFSQHACKLHERYIHHISQTILLSNTHPSTASFGLANFFVHTMQHRLQHPAEACVIRCRSPCWSCCTNTWTARASRQSSRAPRSCRYLAHCISVALIAKVSCAQFRTATAILTQELPGLQAAHHFLLFIMPVMEVVGLRNLNSLLSDPACSPFPLWFLALRHSLRHSNFEGISTLAGPDIALPCFPRSQEIYTLPSRSLAIIAQSYNVSPTSTATRPPSLPFSSGGWLHEKYC